MWERGDADSGWDITEGVQESVCATEDRLCVYLPVWVILVVWYACHPLVWSQVCLGLLGNKNAPFCTNALSLLPTRFDFLSSLPPLPLFSALVLFLSGFFPTAFSLLRLLLFTFCALPSGCWGLRFLAAPISLSGCLTLAEYLGR